MHLVAAPVEDVVHVVAAPIEMAVIRGHIATNKFFSEWTAVKLAAELSVELVVSMLEGCAVAAAAWVAAMQCSTQARVLLASGSSRHRCENTLRAQRTRGSA